MSMKNLIVYLLDFVCDLYHLNNNTHNVLNYYINYITTGTCRMPIPPSPLGTRRCCGVKTKRLLTVRVYPVEARLNIHSFASRGSE